MNCPVCGKTVQPTAAGNLYRHRDKCDKPCPGSGLPRHAIQAW